ncbi:hypothetical protein GCM10025867_19710 [Frondihabitans sucicola]|uniref:Non-reducing end beta-L-arabinofuranosidase-like GH127 C-terminal domain-containing protein n=1 Tax=Frondihabitans sucicola TaxID=1268041 RepID=A0ABM8GMS1_9MICO|nr:hypothetical protein [Frondihabitans sucicola]BDZ49730.1 hypothetical protein GCM10025867_19710 [Frondihabitans sucicola]
MTVDDLKITRPALSDLDAPDLFGGIPVVTFEGTSRPLDPRAYSTNGTATGSAADPTIGRPSPDSYAIAAIPYFLWANRHVGPMKVWIPEV